MEGKRNMDIKVIIMNIFCTIQEMFLSYVSMDLLLWNSQTRLLYLTNGCWTQCCSRTRGPASHGQEWTKLVLSVEAGLLLFGLELFVYLSEGCPQTVCVCLSLQSCLTLCDPVDCSPPGSSVHGILQARILEWVAVPSSRGIFPIQELNPYLLQLPHCRQILYSWSTGEAPYVCVCDKKEKETKITHS